MSSYRERTDLLDSLAVMKQFKATTRVRSKLLEKESESIPFLFRDFALSRLEYMCASNFIDFPTDVYHTFTGMEVIQGFSRQYKAAQTHAKMIDDGCAGRDS